MIDLFLQFSSSYNCCNYPPWDSRYWFITSGSIVFWQSKFPMLPLAYPFCSRRPCRHDNPKICLTGKMFLGLLFCRAVFQIDAMPQVLIAQTFCFLLIYCNCPLIWSYSFLFITYSCTKCSWKIPKIKIFPAIHQCLCWHSNCFL